MTPLVSVVVPVYKVEDYLERCVDSILDQTYTNLEVILVDDGSPDQCPRICDAYADKDKRIKVIHKKNGGLSDARNAGIQIAQGRYITFIDSDDWVLPDYIDVLLKLIRENNAQVSICCFQRVAHMDEVKTDNGMNAKIFNKVEALKMLLYQRYYDNSAWGKLYHTEIIKRHLYPKGKLFEDLGTTYKILDECERIAWTSKRMYCYFINNNSITQQDFSPNRMDIVGLVDEQYAYITRKHPELTRAAMSRKFSAYSYAYRQLKDQGNEWEELRRKLWDYIKENCVDLLFDCEARIKNRLAALCACAGKRVFNRF